VNLRAEDMSWLDATAAGECIVLTKDGNVIWDAIAPTTGNYTRSKPYWVNGLSIQQLPSGVLTITIN
jgi:antitoxin (DNA-binding transcriptional repressor) of toxin-antitoxin stability system